MALQRLKDVAEKAKLRAVPSVKETEINLPFIISTGRNEALSLQTICPSAKLRGAHRATSSIAPSRSCAPRSKSRDPEEPDRGRDPGRRHDAHAEGASKRSPSSSAWNRARAFTRRGVASAPRSQGAALTDDKSDILLLDVTPHSLGIMIVGGYFDKLIEQTPRCRRRR